MKWGIGNLPEVVLMQCPVCRKQFDPPKGARHLPFCSHRCRNIDLGRWLEESYTIEGPSPNDFWWADGDEDEYYRE
ncbi:DNA gyrase inhibitor YacG [Planctomycetales bacterium 10988]|nr:DNA gyrase inhibitor YacG [Planctomycetales bacterium 10988]